MARIKISLTCGQQQPDDTRLPQTSKVNRTSGVQ